MSGNALYYGDNLQILRRYVADESVDLIYIDPPFNSNADYNVLFKAQNGARAAAQLQAFTDTWQWDLASARVYDELVQRGGRVGEALQAFRRLLGNSDLLAYLAMMAVRLVELHRVLRATGSLYLHCDPGASHYLKIVLDAIFGPVNFRNEIVWQRTASKGLMSRRLPRNHDILLAYQKSDAATWHGDAIFTAYDEAELDEKTASKYCQRDPDGRRYQLTSLLNPNTNRPNLTYEFLGVTRVWRWTRERMQAAYEAGIVVQSRPGAVPRMKRYLDEQRGKPLGDTWSDIAPLNSQARERLGYPTQKPEALLDRIIRLSSHDDDVVLDAFCGCGTAIAAAQKLGRRWIGIDITYAAIRVITHRLETTFGPAIVPKPIGEPETVEDAAILAQTDPYQFQWWALGLVGARPEERKKGADHGIDGRLVFDDEGQGDYKAILFSVKAGLTGVAHVRDLRGVIEREGAPMGVLLTFREPSRPMRAEAASAGTYESPGWGTRHPRLQILTVGELLAGHKIDCPPLGQVNRTLPNAPKQRREIAQKRPLPRLAAIAVKSG